MGLFVVVVLGRVLGRQIVGGGQVVVVVVVVVVHTVGLEHNPQIDQIVEIVTVVVVVVDKIVGLLLLLVRCFGFSMYKTNLCLFEESICHLKEQIFFFF